MPLMTWATHVLQWMEQRAAKRRRWSQSHKTILSSDCRLQLAYMKQESLVIADQHAAVNTFPGLVHTRSEEHTSELQSRFDLVCRLLLEKKKKPQYQIYRESERSR